MFGSGAHLIAISASDCQNPLKKVRELEFYLLYLEFVDFVSKYFD